MEVIVVDLSHSCTRMAYVCVPRSPWPFTQPQCWVRRLCLPGGNRKWELSQWQREVCVFQVKLLWRHVVWSKGLIRFRRQRGGPCSGQTDRKWMWRAARGHWPALLHVSVATSNNWVSLPADGAREENRRGGGQVSEPAGTWDQSVISVSSLALFYTHVWGPDFSGSWSGLNQAVPVTPSGAWGLSVDSAWGNYPQFNRWRQLSLWRFRL